MAIIKSISSKASIGNAINYVTDKEKTEEKLVEGINCNPSSVIDEMKTTKSMYDKTDGRQYMHFVQSFHPDDDVSAEQVHKMGMEFMQHEKFKGHEIIVATHINKKHKHNHFIINSVNYESGNKYRHSKSELQQLKKFSNELSKQYGLTVPQKTSQGITTFNQKKYKAIEKGIEGNYKSYILDTAIDIKKSLLNSTDKKSFISNMEKKKYKVNWTDKRKYITFTTHEGQKVRNSLLEKTFKDNSYGKENITNELERKNEQFNSRRNQQRTSSITRAEHDSITKTEHDSKNAIREHSTEGEYGTIADRISEVEQGIFGQDESTNESIDRDSENAINEQRNVDEYDRRSQAEHEQDDRESERENEQNAREHEYEYDRDDDEFEWEP